MPKKKKTEQATDHHEGRPVQLTLGDFLAVPVNKKVNKKDSGQEKVQDSQCGEAASHESSLANDDNTCSGNEFAEDFVWPVQDTLEKRDTNMFICRTKKGSVPVKVESRSSGKKVTIIEHVQGEAKLFLQELKTKFGTGGILKEDTIELQGDCKVKVTKYLNENKHLLKPFGTKI